MKAPERKYDPVTISMYVTKTNVMYKELSLLAYEKKTQKVLAVSEEAGNLPENESFILLSPVNKGMIADYTVGVKLLSLLLQKALDKNTMNPRLIVCIPPRATEVERKAFIDAFYQAGAESVMLTDSEFENVIREDSNIYDLVVGMGEKEEPKPVEEPEELWEEVFKGKIPADNYRTQLSTTEENGLKMVLTGKVHKVILSFKSIWAIRMLDEGLGQSGLFCDNEMKRFGENQFSNVIYQIQNGDFYQFADRIGGEYTQLWELKHYLIITSNLKVEILTEALPVIKVDK